VDNGSGPRLPMTRKPVPGRRGRPRLRPASAHDKKVWLLWLQPPEASAFGVPSLIKSHTAQRMKVQSEDIFDGSKMKTFEEAYS
jgi:hypothetical protein